MDKALVGVVSFAVGALAGFVLAKIYTEKKNADLVNEEIETARQFYQGRIESFTELTSDEDGSDIEITEDDEPLEIDNDVMDYTLYAATNTETEIVNDTPPEDKPYILKPEEFGILDEYEVSELVYYAGDDVVVDDHGEPLENARDIVGEDFREHFGEYEPYSVFVRNDRHMCDYQILLDNGRYGETV